MSAKSMHPVLAQINPVVDSTDYDGYRYAHIFINFVWIDEEGRPRTFSDSDCKDSNWDQLELLQGLRIYSQMHSSLDLGDQSNFIYGWYLEYHEVYSVSLEQAEWMARTLKRIEAKYKKLVGRFGSPKTFGQYVAFICDAMGVKGVATKGKFDSKWWVASSRDIASTVDYQVSLIVEAWKADPYCVPANCTNVRY